MDVIKAVESYSYYHNITGQSREEWEAWRVHACEEWMLNKAILGKEGENNGSSKSESDHSSNDRFLHVSKRDCGGSRRIRQHCVSDAARLSGETREIREGLPGVEGSSRGCD